MVMMRIEGTIRYLKMLAAVLATAMATVFALTLAPMEAHAAEGESQAEERSASDLPTSDGTAGSHVGVDSELSARSDSPDTLEATTAENATFSADDGAFSATAMTRQDAGAASSENAGTMQQSEEPDYSDHILETHVLEDSVDLADLQEMGSSSSSQSEPTLMVTSGDSPTSEDDVGAGSDGDNGDSADDANESSSLPVSAVVDKAASPADAEVAQLPASCVFSVDADGIEKALSASDGKYSLVSDGTYRIVGRDVSPVDVSAATARIILDNVTIDARGSGASALSLSEATSAIIEIIGANLLIGDENQAGIHVPAGAELQINGDDDAECSLTVIGNAGIDYSNTADASAKNWSSGCGIGGIGWTGKGVNSSSTPCPYAASGKVSIDGKDGNLTLSAIAGGRGASGIGGGYGAVSSDIVIVGTNLIHVSGGCANAEPETGNNKPEYAKETLEGGAAIGAGTKGTAGGKVVIDGCYGRNIVGGGKSAGIGGGCWADDVSVIIRNSDLSVIGGTTGAAIGTGRAQSDKDISVEIYDSVIEAVGGYFGAGIGLGANGSNYALELAHVLISGSTVKAYGGAGAAGIGGGIRGYNVCVTVQDGSDVEAYAGVNYQGKYTEKYNPSSDSVSGSDGIGQTGAAAIGRGAWGSVNFNAGKGANSETAKNPSLSISADSSVKAFSNGDNWAIAGFTDTDGVEQPLLLLRFSRNYDIGGADFDTRTPDEADGLDWEALFIDGRLETELVIRDAETLEHVAEVVLPAVGEEFANGYTGAGRCGYYAVALNLPAGSYKISTSSDLRTLTRIGDVIVTPGDDNYIGGASYLAGGDMTRREPIFTVDSDGFNAFDRVAFRYEAEPDLVSPEEPDAPDEPGEPDALNQPGAEDKPGDDSFDEPGEEVAEEKTTSEQEEPEIPTTEKQEQPLPVSETEDESWVSAPVPVSETTAPPISPASPGAPGGVIPDSVATVLSRYDVSPTVYPDLVQFLSDDVIAEVESLSDDEVPLSAFDGEGEHGLECWVHWFILLGILLTGAYSVGVIARRRRFSSRLDRMDRDIMSSDSEDDCIRESSIQGGRWGTPQLA